MYVHAPDNDVSVNDGPHILRWSHNIIILQYLPLYDHIYRRIFVVPTHVSSLEAVLQPVH